MTAHELARWLLKQPDCKVVIASDAEGNSFDYMCAPELTRYLESDQECLHPDDYADNPDAIDVICFWP